jgi:pyruvate,water dikinase
MSASTSRAGLVIPLADLAAVDREAVGSKAANLGELLRAGFPVPQGFVVCGDPAAELNPDTEAAIRAAALAPGDVPLAVRSSAAAEDLSDASFAGQYETVLDVRGPDALLDAIRAVRASAATARVQQYQAARGRVAAGDIAVLVQRMLAPEAAGVAFTANPISGRRDEVVITAGRGLGERVVSGVVVGDEWVVRDSRPVQTRSVEGAINADRAAEIAALARRVERHFGVPQDIEWAVEGGQLHLLQARPMTALPEALEWTSPEPGYWMRNFRFGEWLSDPMTPLFQDWLLERLNQGLLAGMRRSSGGEIALPSAELNGWYYAMAGQSPGSIPHTLLPALVQTRGRILSFMWNALVLVNTNPERADRALLGELAQQWREQLLPAYQRLVANAESGVENATTQELRQTVDSIGHAAGEQFWSLAVVGGSAWKMEACITRFTRKHLPHTLSTGIQVLLRGLPGAAFDAPPHGVQSIDWYWPTAGELGWARPDTTLDERRRGLAAEREAAVSTCRQALAGRPELLQRFDSLLGVTQRYAVLREEQAHWFTLGWPVLRRSVLRLGEQLRLDGMLENPEDIFFATRRDLEIRTGLRDAVTRGRETWERRRRLFAPLTIGTPPRLIDWLMPHPVAAHGNGAPAAGGLLGQGASPGRATGRVRILSGPEDFDAFQPGEVLVAQSTAPAWTPLFGRAAAVVTDGGTLAAHASLVAREYGIPAVVGTGQATRRLATGQLVTVDGTTGTVRVVGDRST